MTSLNECEAISRSKEESWLLAMSAMHASLLLIVAWLSWFGSGDTATPCYIPLTELALTEHVDPATSAVADSTSSSAAHVASSIGADVAGGTSNENFAGTVAVATSVNAVTRTTGLSVIAETGDGCSEDTANFDVASEGCDCGIVTTSLNEARAYDEPSGRSATPIDTSTSWEKVGMECSLVQENSTPSTSSQKYEIVNPTASISPTPGGYATLCIPYCAALDQYERCVSIRGCGYPDDSKERGCCPSTFYSRAEVIGLVSFAALIVTLLVIVRDRCDG